jgi:hypothetical protein
VDQADDGRSMCKRSPSEIEACVAGKLHARGQRGYLWLRWTVCGSSIFANYITDPQTSHSADFVGAIAGRLDLADTHCNLANHSCIRPSAFASIVVQDKNTVEGWTRLCSSRLIVGIVTPRKKASRSLIDSRLTGLGLFVDNRTRCETMVTPRLRGDGMRLGNEVYSRASLRTCQGLLNRQSRWH